MHIVGHYLMLLFKHLDVFAYCRDVAVRRISLEKIVGDSGIRCGASFLHLGGIGLQMDSCLDDRLDEPA